VQDSIHSVEVVFLLLLFFVVAFGVLARRLRTPYPIVLVIGGLLLSFVRGIPLGLLRGVSSLATSSVFFRWRSGL